MINLNDILYSATNRISYEFEEDIFVDEQIQGFHKSCFFVQVLPGSSSASTKTTDRKVPTIAIKYLQEEGQSKVNLNDVLMKLEKLFNRTIRVKERYLKISNTESTILKDEIGYTLDYLINLEYHDDIFIDEEVSEPMNDIKLRF